MGAVFTRPVSAGEDKASVEVERVASMKTMKPKAHLGRVSQTYIYIYIYIYVYIYIYIYYIYMSGVGIVLLSFSRG